MIAPNYNEFCAQAERHYFDFLRNEAEQPVPEEVIDHIMGCLHCREQINRLEAMLAEFKEHPAQHQMAAAAILKLHFSFVGKRVNCADVRPFLPNLLVPTMQIRIPTPITAHIDNCEQCREDSRELQDLGLSQKQLVILSQLFAEEFDADQTDCAEAREAIHDVAAMAFERTSAKTLRHLSLCVKCREKLYRFRQEIIERIKSNHQENKNPGSILACSSVKTSDVFDYSIPYGIDPESDEYAKFRKSLTAHLVGCADCLEKIQQLHKTIYTIAERPESGVVTVFHIDSTAEVEQENLYAGFPVRVDTLRASLRETADLDYPVQAHSEKFETAVKLKPATKRFKPLLKIALPAAAVLMIGIGLFYNIHTATGLGIEKIYGALEMVKNIHTINIDPDNQSVAQERWIARNAGLYVVKTKNICILSDISARVRKTKDFDTGITEQVPLNNGAMTEVTNMIHGSLHLMPFRTPSDISADAKWSEIRDPRLNLNAVNTKVYELSWDDKASYGSTIKRILRIFSDSSTNLPKKIQWFNQSLSDSEPVLESVMIIEYPDDKEMLAKAETMSF
jgi:hypothetical protein